MNHRRVRIIREVAQILQDGRLIGDSAAVGRAVDLLKQVIAATTEGDTDLPGHLSNLAAVLSIRFEQTGKMADLDEAVRVGQLAVKATPEGHADLAAMLSNLGGALHIRFKFTGQMADLDEAVRVGQLALKATPEGHADLARYWSNLGVALQTRFERAGRMADIDEAVRVGRQAVEAAPPDDRNLAMYWSNLGLALQYRFYRTGQMADIDDAVRVARLAVKATPDGHPNLARMLSALGGALRIRFDRTGQMADLDEAVHVGQLSVAATPDGQPHLGGLLSKLGTALRTRFETTGRLDDLDEAVRVLRHAVEATPGGQPVLGLRLSGLGATLLTRFKRSRQLSDLDEAVLVCRQAVAATPDGDSELPIVLANLGLALRSRFEYTGRLDDLDESVCVQRRALAVTPDGHPAMATYLSNLGNALRSRYEVTEQRSDLDEAIRIGQRAVAAVPAGQPDLAGMLSNLGLALRGRFEGTGQQADLDEAVRVVRRGTAVTAAGPAWRVVCGRLWVGWAAGSGDWQGAREAVAAVMPLLPQLADQGLGVEDRRFRLAALNGLGPAAAWASVHGGRAPGIEAARQAWSVLDAARGILLGQALETRDDLTALHRDHPQLAEQVLQLRRILNQDPGSGEVLAAPDEIGESRAAGTGADRTAAAAQWIQLMPHIRSLPGLDRFGLPPTVAQMHAAAGDGSLVAVIVTENGCGALLMDGSTAGFLPLPDLTEAAVIEQAERFLHAVHPSRVRDLDPALTDTKPFDAHAVSSDVLGWLWDTVCEPILDHLGHTDAVTGGRWPRVWWIPTGALAMLPLHAAGHHDQPGQAVLDRVISSYTPTVRTLWHARRHNTPASTTSALIAGINTVGYDSALPDLAYAESEARLVHQQLVPATPPLLGSDATHRAVLQALQKAGWAHFACHGFADQTTPGDSHLVLHDRPLPVREMASLDLSGAYLAVLSACTTAVTAQDTLDEPIHLASAFQLAGFAHTIATLWPISDTHAPMLTEHLYQQLVTGTPPSDALHHTTRWARANPDLHKAPHLWASHIHLGP